MTAPSPSTHPAERETPAGEARREAVIREMAESWDDFVSDTGCFPDDFTILPRRRLQFIAGRWAGLFADALLGPNGPIASELARLTERAEAAEARAKAAEKALVSLTPDGSEYYSRDGRDFVVDVTACMAFIMRAKNDKHSTIKRLIGLKQAAEAALTTLRADHAAEVARLRDELKAAQ